jgi:multiple sugar transport system substrate-binding protein
MRRMIASTFLAVMAAATPAFADGTITILWAQWDPANNLQKVCDEYGAANKVKVVVAQKPWGDYGNVKNQEFAGKSATYDIFIGDSQWMGQGATSGHYVEITDIIKDNPDFKDVMPAALSYYCEYPKGSGKYYAVPCESDAMGIAYRKDLLQDPKHVAGYSAYLKEKGQPDAALGVPKTWNELLWICKYFKEKGGMAGIVMPTETGYDGVTMSYEAVMWSFGADWGDQSKNTPTVNTKEQIEAMTFFKELLDTSTDGGKNLDYGAVLGSYAAGRSVFALDFFANFPGYASRAEDKNPKLAGKTGFMNVPKGPKGQATALGGQGMSINAHIDAARQAQAKDFIKWFSKPETQKKWAAVGGYTAVKSILTSDEFIKQAPYNALFMDAFGMMKDYWNIPQYDQLLTATQNNLSDLIQGKKTPADAAKDMQTSHEKTFSNIK